MTGQVVTWHDSEDQELWGTPWSSPEKPFLCDESHTQVWGERSVTKCLQRRERAWGQSSRFHIKPRLGDVWFYPSTGEVETGEALALARSRETLPLIMKWKVSLDKFSPPPSLGPEFSPWDPHSRGRTDSCMLFSDLHTCSGTSMNPHSKGNKNDFKKQRAEGTDTWCWILVSKCTCMHTHTWRSTHKANGQCRSLDYICF